VKIRIRDGGIEPAFGIFDDSVLIFDRHNTVFRLVGADEHRLVDDRHSACWSERDGKLAFAEFFETYFTENLAGGAPREKFVAEGYFELFEREFPDPDAKIPQYYGDGLVRCPRCGRIFRPLSYLGQIKCNDRGCGMEMNNPFYAPERLKESIEWKRLSHLAEYADQYYCAANRRYYPARPSRTALLVERACEWFRERRGRGK